MKIMLGFDVHLWEVNQVRRAIQRDWDRVPNMQAHITLKVPVEIDGFDDPTYTNLCEACDELSRSVKPFVGTLRGFSTFGSHVVFADVELTAEFHAFSELLNATLTAWGFSLNGFETNRIPHVTLATGFKDTGEAEKIIAWVREQDYLEMNKGGVSTDFNRITMYGKPEGEQWKPMKEFCFNG